MENPELMKAIQKIQNIKDNNINNFNFIASLCDYLLFLIEDLNSFVKFGLLKKVQKEKKDKDHSSTVSEHSIEKSFNTRMTYLNLRQLLDFCFNLFYIKQAYDSSKPFLKITKDYSPDLADKFYTNEIKLKQVIINLLSNAYKFTVSGFVKLSAKLITYDNKKCVFFSIIDTGSGIEKDEMNLLFKPFEIVNRNQIHNCHGSGLGLSIVADILELFESKIHLESVPGKGSTFSFELEHRIPKNISCKILEDDEDDENVKFMANSVAKDVESNHIFILI